MFKKLLLVLFALSFGVAISCSDQKSQEQPRAKAEKKEKEEMTVEKYCAFYNDYDKLMMEKYWPKFKGKEYSEVKDLYDEYKKEEGAIYTKHNVEYNDLASFFRSNFSAVEKYRQNDPNYKSYPEKQKAKETLVGFAMKKGMGE